jgi:hypothetical protein
MMKLAIIIVLLMQPFHAVPTGGFMVSHFVFGE